MIISASIKNGHQKNDITVATGGHQKPVSIPGKPEGYGSSVNGGELLMLALATCFCNDIYREAARRNIKIDTVEVTATGEFAKEGTPGTNIVYEVNIQSPHAQQDITTLINDVDRIAEIHSTVRQGTPVILKR